MPSSLLPATPAFTAAEAREGHYDVRTGALKAYLARIKAITTGPNAEPAFIPADPFQPFSGICPKESNGQNYRGLLIVPTTWPKSTLNP